MADLFGDALGLGEEQEVVGAAGLGVRPAHVEAAEGVGSDHGSGALAVQYRLPTWNSSRARSSFSREAE